jgi:chromosome partitioning protein
MIAPCNLRKSSKATARRVLSMTLTICVMNNKGGVGKTSTCHHLSGEFAKRGLRVLLLDMDPQRNLTQGFLGSEDGSVVPAQSSVAALFDDSLFVNPTAIIRQTPIERIFLLPGSRAMQKHDTPSPELAGEKQLVLRDFLSEVKGNFNVVLVDCPPNIYLSAWSALVASEFVIVPLQAEDYGAQGVFEMRHVISSVQGGPNPELKLLGYLITMFNQRLGIHTAFNSMLREHYGKEMFSTIVPLAAPYKEAVSHHLPIGYYKPKSKAGQVTRKLADEVLERAQAFGGEGTTEMRRVA